MKTYTVRVTVTAVTDVVLEAKSASQAKDVARATVLADFSEANIPALVTDLRVKE